MKYYTDAHDRIIEASNREASDQCLFLVADVHNQYDKAAVMLHNGVQKLGHVAASECDAVRRYLTRESEAHGQDVVLVVHVPAIKDDSFLWDTSFKVKAVGVVHERVARKFAASILKER